MATEKIINTRIQLKYDTLANWNANSSLILRKGEVGICAIPTSSSHLQTTPPAIMFKVGDGVVDAQGTITGTQFKDLPWASALAADVYAWAKKSVPDVADFGDIIAAARNGLISENAVVKTLNALKGDVIIEPASGETHIVVGKDGQKITLKLELTLGEQAALASGITFDKVEKYEAYDKKITDVKTTADAALPEATFNAFKTENTKAIEAAKKAGTDAADALSAYKTSNDAAVAGKVSKTTKINGHVLSNDVTLSKSDVELGNVENKTLDTAVTASSGNYITSGAVKSYVDSAIGAVKQFKYEVVNELPSAAAVTMGKIYLVAHTHGAQDGYDEFITIEKNGTYSWEKIGNTDIDLSQYVNGISGTTNNGVVTNISKNGNTIAVTSKSLKTADPNIENGNTIAFIKSVSQAADGKITAHKQNVPTATKTQLGLVKAGTTSGKTYGVDVAADGAMTVNVPWEDTQNDNTWRNITLNGTAYKGTGINTGALNLVSGNNVDISIKDAGKSTEGVQIAAKNQTVKVGSKTFGADDAVEIKGDKDTNISVEADTTAKTITIKGKSDTDINTLIDTKIGGLVGAITGTAGAGKTLTALTQTNGKVSATFDNISITHSQVSDFTNAVENQINTHSGVDKVGTVISVGAGVGLTITGSKTTTPKVEIDDSVVFVFNCGSATELVD